MSLPASISPAQSPGAARPVGRTGCGEERFEAQRVVGARSARWDCAITANDPSTWVVGTSGAHERRVSSRERSGTATYRFRVHESMTVRSAPTEAGMGHPEPRLRLRRNSETPDHMDLSVIFTEKSM